MMTYHDQKYRLSLQQRSPLAKDNLPHADSNVSGTSINHRLKSRSFFPSFYTEEHHNLRPCCVVTQSAHGLRPLPVARRRVSARGSPRDGSRGLLWSEDGSSQHMGGHSFVQYSLQNPPSCHQTIYNPSFPMRRTLGLGCCVATYVLTTISRRTRELFENHL